ncbi:MAG: DUF192 domain-containing protein [Planctomycetes bacterium]|nr:DUF192 domain-containing protein [Planctomycetota bacterium]
MSAAARVLCALLALAAGACSGGSGAGAGQAGAPPGDYPADLPRPAYRGAVIEVSGLNVTVEIADTEERRRYGLMFVSELGDDRGMLFVYPQARALGFWMRNTRIPLDIAFLGEQGGELRIINIRAGMEPYRESPSYKSLWSCRFALELPGGWFARHGGAAGDRVAVPEEILKLAAEPDQPFSGNIPRLLKP